MRVNSQSGKDKMSYLLKTTHNLDLPRRLQIEFSRIVQRHADTRGGEVDAGDLWTIFTDEYLPAKAAPGAGLPAWGRYELKGATLTAAGDEDSILTVTLRDGGQRRLLTASGNGPLDAFVTALEQTGVEVRILDYVEHALSQGRDTSSLCRPAETPLSYVNEKLLASQRRSKPISWLRIGLLSRYTS